ASPTPASILNLLSVPVPGSPRARRAMVAAGAVRCPTCTSTREFRHAYRVLGLMRAVVITEHGGPAVLPVPERPAPPWGPGDVRIAVKAAGINFADTLARTGLYPDSPKVPCVVGYEVAGEVESVGDGVESVKPGDRVLAGTRFNGQAELVTVCENIVYELPE